MPFSPNASDVYRDHVTKFVPVSGVNKPKKSEIRTYLRQIEDAIDGLSLDGLFQGQWDASSGVFPSEAEKGFSWIVGTPGTVGGKYFGEGDKLVALVAGASPTVYNDNWAVIPAGTSGVVAATDAGEGSANAIAVASDYGGGLRDGVLLAFTLFEDTTGSPVTVSVNGAAPLRVKTNRGNDASALTAGMFVIGQVRLGDAELRLLNDQDVSALVGLAEDAATRAEDAAEAAEAAAEASLLREPFVFGVSGNGTVGPYNLGANIAADSAILLFLDGNQQQVGSDFTYSGSSITFTTLVPGAGNKISGVIFAVRGVAQPAQGSVSETELAPEVLGLVNPLSGFHPNGDVDDTVRFQILRGIPSLSGLNLDLSSGTYLANGGFPSGRTRNGFLAKQNALGGMTFNYPALDTIKADSMRLSQGYMYQGWFQGKPHEYKGVVYAPSNYSTSHSGTTGAIKMLRSLDGGHSFTRQELLFRPASGRTTSWSAGQYNGHQFIVVQTEDSGGVLQSIKLYGRRLFDFWEQQPLRVQTFAASSTARVYIPNAGVRPGSTFRVVSGFGTIAGIPFTGNFTVTDCRNSYFDINLGGSASIDTDLTYTGRFGFPEGDFTEVLFGGSNQDFGTFMVSNTSLGSLPNLVHDFAARRVGSVDALYFGISSGSTDAILKVTNIFRTSGNRAIEWLKQLPGAGLNVSEPTICTDGSSMFGFLRHQASPTGAAARFWWSDDDLTTITAYDLPIGRAVAYLSPIAVAVWGDYLIALASGDRTPEAVGGSSTPLYLMYSTKAAAKTSSWDSWTSVPLGMLPRTPSASSAIGVPGIAVISNKAMLFYGAEEYPQSYPSTEQGVIANLFCLAVGLDFITGGSAYEEFIGPAPVQPARLAVVEVDRGEGPGGTYVRFADGTQICYGLPIASGATSTATGNIFTSGDLVWTFPADFADSPVVSGSTRRTSGNGVGWLGNLETGASRSNFTFRVLASANDHAANAYLTATGRWF